MIVLSRVSAILLLLAPSSSALKVCHEGNSLTIQNKQPDMLQFMAQSVGLTQSTTVFAQLGASVVHMWLHPGEDYTRLVSQPVDVFTLQPYGDDENTIAQYGSEFCRLVYQGNNNAQVYIYAQWPDSSENPAYFPSVSYKHRLACYENCADTLTSIFPNAKPVLVIPGGPVIDTLRLMARRGEVPGAFRHC